MKSLDDLKFENEEDLRHFNPKFLIENFYNYFDEVSVKYGINFREVWQHRKKKRSFFKKENELLKQLDTGKIVKRVVREAENAMRAVEQGKKIKKSKKSDQAVELLEQKLNYISNYKFDEKTFGEINDEFHSINTRNAIMSKISNALIGGWRLKLIIIVLTFFLTILISTYIEKPLDEHFQYLGPIKSTLLVTIFTFFVIDRLFDLLKDYLLWKNVEFYYRKMIKIKLLVAKAVELNLIS